MGPRRFGFVLAAFVLVALLPQLGAHAAEEYFVSPDGNDSGSGSESSPWASFDHALSQLGRGDTLTARGGTYREEVRNPDLASGTADEPITVRAYPGERPVIEGLLWLRDADYWRFDGLNVTWGDGDHDEHMVKLTDGTGWEYVNSEIWGAESFAGMLVATSGGSEPDNWRVAGNCIHDTAPVNSTNNDHLIYANSGHQGSGVIEGNVMFEAPNGNGVKLGGSSADSGGASNITVRDNTIVDTHQSILISWSSANNRIENNLLYGVTDRYANIRSYQLRGTGNQARNNAGGGSADMFWNDSDDDSDYVPITDQGNNTHGIQPDFDRAGCNGYNPTNPQAQTYGHVNSQWRTEGQPQRDSTRQHFNDDEGGSSGSAGSESSTTADDDRADSGDLDTSANGDAFADDDRSVFESDIDRLAEVGVTNGCNPPEGDRFCPDRAITRAEMATFLAEAETLNGNSDRFGDIAGSVHARNIRSLAAARITLGCNPPDNDRYCPNRPVSRGEMASFLVRTGGLAGDGERFGDIATSVHAADIRALDSAGVTNGCNPPENDRYCPDRAVTRGEMAAFLVRMFYR